MIEVWSWVFSVHIPVDAHTVSLIIAWHSDGRSLNSHDQIVLDMLLAGF